MIATMKGAFDGTMILVNVPCEDRPKYRTRKGTLAMNVLEVCSPEMEFTYVLLGWEGSTHDGRILRDAISRPNGLKVPKGCYYLCDGGCTNGEGFLAPYRGHLYHLKEWNRGPDNH
uniref:DDE Tnp4 domain-containing protein n=1 Tax=Chenopodium quinoa TaxID=63459 RepID=A0A803N396_CHEQI